MTSKKFIISIRRSTELREIKKLFPPFDSWVLEGGMTFSDLKKIQTNQVLIGRLNFNLTFKLGEFVDLMYFYIPVFQGAKAEDAFSTWDTKTATRFRGNQLPMFREGRFLFFEYIISRKNGLVSLTFTQQKLTAEEIIKKHGT